MFYKCEVFTKKTIIKINKAIQKPKEAIENLAAKYVYYDKLLNSKGAIYSVEFLKRKILKLLKILKPKKASIEIDYSSTEPDKPAKLLEAYAFLMPILPKKTIVMTGFDDDFFKFDIDIKGSFVLGRICIIAIGVVLNRKVMKFIKLLKKGTEIKA